ncbi:hypothetical protein B0H11DRAFT_2024504 [Mycena galericulata]|nr:hypothetical protein B0H11DRAFT_2024504 [Mycena galericulata]
MRRRIWSTADERRWHVRFLFFFLKIGFPSLSSPPVIPCFVRALRTDRTASSSPTSTLVEKQYSTVRGDYKGSLRNLIYATLLDERKPKILAYGRLDTHPSFFFGTSWLDFQRQRRRLKHLNRGRRGPMDSRESIGRRIPRYEACDMRRRNQVIAFKPSDTRRLTLGFLSWVCC